MLPNFLIIGAARCGTTYTARNLMTHPDIYIPEKKELHFFDRDYDQGLQYYGDQFDNVAASNAKMVGETTPAYLYFPQIPYLIKKYLGDIKIITILRDPVERAYSHYWNMVAKDDDFKKSSFEDKIVEYPRLVEEGKYYERLKTYFELFPKENILILFFEELTNNPSGYFNKIYNFLGVDQNFTSPLITHKLNTSANKNGHSKLLFTFYKVFTKAIKMPRIAKAIQKANSKEVPKMKKATRDILGKEFLDSNRNLEKLLGKSLSIWNNSRNN